MERSTDEALEQKQISSCRKGVHYAWWVLAACCVVQFAGCGIYSNSIGIFMPWTCAEMGFSTTEYSVSLTIGNLTTMAALPLAGRLIPKYPPRFLITLCIVLCALSLGTSALFTQLWQWYISAVVRGFCGSFFFMVMSPIILSEWFHAKAAFSVGIAMAFSGIGGAVMAPLGNFMIEHIGWRAASAAIAGLSLVMLLPFTLFHLHNRPADLGMEPYGAGTAKAANEPAAEGEQGVQMGQFVKLLLCTSLISVPIIFNVHFAQFSVSLGLSTAVGALMGSCCMVGNIGGKLVLGWLGDKLSTYKSVSAGAVVALLGLGAIFSSGGRESILYVGALFFGVCMSLTAVAVPMIVRDFYTGESYRRVLPLCSMATSAISAFGTGAVGYVYDATGNYNLFIILCMVCYAVLPVYITTFYRKNQKLLQLGKK